MATFTLERITIAPPHVVFDVLTDHRGYAAITPIRSVGLDQDGSPAPNGVGAIRVMRAIGPTIREQVTEYEPPHRFAYRMLSGAPVRDHVGEVTLEELGTGTQVVYRIDTTPTVPLVGPLIVGIMRVGIGQLLKAVIREAERRSTAS